MSSKLLPYVSPTQVRSALFKNAPDSVPPTEELESLHNQLKSLRQKSLERAKKAGEDLKTIEEFMCRMKEKAKGKAKAMDKINRERGCTSFCRCCLCVLIQSSCMCIETIVYRAQSAVLQ